VQASPRITLEPLNRALNLAFGNFFSYLVIGLLITAGAAAAGFFGGFKLNFDQGGEQFSAIFLAAEAGAAVIAWILGTALGFLAAVNSIIWSGAAAHMISMDLRAPGSARFEHGLSAVRERMTPLAALGALYGGIQILSSLVCFGSIFALALYLLFIFAVPIIMFEGAKVGDALKMSGRLVRSRLSGVLGFAVAAGFVSAVLTLLLGFGSALLPAAIALLYLRLTLPSSQPSVA
jgi:hypothetical protein